jgi:hypothetical protein
MSGDAVTPMLDDPLVWHLADGNHVPEEQWSGANSVRVTCREDGWGWPCPTRKALDESGHREECDC